LRAVVPVWELLGVPVPGLRLRRTLLAVLAGVVASLSCGREITGPDGGQQVTRGFLLDVRFPPMGGANSVASDLIPFTKVRVVMVNQRGETVVNRVVDFPSAADTIEIELSVPLSFNAPSEGETMDLSLAFVNAAGDTVFRAGPQPVLVVPSGNPDPPPPPVIEPVYVGPGSNAVSVVISPNGTSLVAGDPFTFTAVAYDAAAQPIANTPIGWESLDPLKATITNSNAGVGVTLPSRGTARIVASLATLQMDTVVITIAPKLQGLVKVSGDAQSATAGGVLSQPAVVRVTATDGLPLIGVTVNFAALNGGSVGTPSAVSGADGLVQTTWTLGAGAGAQSLTATVAGAPAVTTTFTATATIAAVTLIHHYPMTTDVNDVVGTAHGSLIGGASMQEGVLSLDGSTEYVQFAEHLVPSTGSYSVAFFLRSRMSSAITASYISQGASGQPGFSIGHQEGGLSGGEGWPFTGEPAPGPDGLYHHIVLTVDAVGGSSRLYVDGVLQQTLGSAIPAPLGGTDTRLGRTFDPFANYFTGEMDELRIYSGVLNGTEVAALHDTGPTTLGRLIFQQVPSSAQAGAAFTPSVIVRVEDAMGRLRTTFNGNIAIYVLSGPSSLIGTTTVAAVNGIATFSNVFVTEAGTYTLQADNGGGVTAVSASFAVVPGEPDGLVFVQHPTTVAVNSVIAPPITIRAIDPFFNTVTTYTGNVTLAVANNPSGATLGGTTTVAAIAGVATFTDITVSAAGAGYTLAASAAQMGPTFTTAFDVVAGGPTINAWTNVSGGNWNVVGNWSQGRLPLATDSVVIGLAGTYTVTMNVDFGGGSLTVGGGAGVQTLVVPSSRTLSINGLLAVLPGDSLAVTVATLDGAGALVNAGSVVMTDAIVGLNIENDALLVLQGGTDLDGTIVNSASGTMQVLGSSASGAAQLAVSSGFTNEGLLELTAAAGTGFNVTMDVGLGALVNQGTIQTLPSSGGTRTLGFTLDNQGTVIIGTGTILSGSSADHLNSGTINVSGGNLTVSQSGTTPTFANAGTIALSAGRTAAFTSGTVDLTGGTVTGYAGTLSVTGATLLFTNPTVRTRLAVGAGTVIPSPFTVPAGDSLRLVTGTFTAPNLVIDGTVIVEDVVSISSAITKTATSSLIVRATATFGAATLTVANGFANNGVIELTAVGSGSSSTLDVTTGTLLNAAGGTILSSAGSGGSRFLGVQLDNQGTLTVNTVLTLAKASSTQLNNGTINVAGANLTVTSSGTLPRFENKGPIILSSGRTLTVSGGVTDLTEGTISGYAATLSTSATNLFFTVPSARTRLAFGAGTVIPSPFTVPAGDSLRLITGTFTAPTLQNDGDLIIEDAVTISSAITTGAAPSRILVRATAAFGLGTLTVTDGFTNTSTIELSSVGSGSGATVNVTNGTLVNGATGVILTSAGSGGSRTLGVQLDNQGLVTVNTTTSLTKADAVHVNSGTIAVVGGNLTITLSGTAPSFSNTGSIPLTANRQLSANGGTFDLTGGTVSGYDATLATFSTTLIFTVPEARTRLALGTSTAIPAAFTVPAGDSLRLITGTFAAPTLQNDGDLIIEDAVTITSAITTGPAPSRILVRSTAAFGTGVLTVASGFTNTSTIELSSVGSGSTSTLNVTTGSLVNGPTGVILTAPGSGGSRILGVQLDNQGLVTVSAPTTLTRLDADHLNSGTIDVAGANLTITQTGTTPSFSNTGSIPLTAARTLSVSGGTLDLTGGTVSGYSSTLATSSTTLIFTVPDARTRLALGASTAIPSAFTVPAGDSLRLITGTFAAPTLQNDGTLIIEDAVTVSSAITTGASPSRILVRSTAAFGTGALTVLNGFTNTSLIELNSVASGSTSTLNVTNGTLLNASTGIILTAPGAGGARTLGVQLDNQGIVQVNAATTLAKADADHVNSGTIDVAGANLTITQTGTTPTFANGGAILLAATRQLAAIGGTFDLSGGTVDGYAGTLATQTTTLIFTVPEARTRLALGTSTAIPSAFTIPAGDSLRLITGTFTAPTLQNDGTLIIEDVVGITSAITTGPAPSRILVRSVAAFGSGTLTVSNGFANTSTIELTSIGSGSTSSLIVTNGTLLNSPSGVVLMSPGSGGSRNLDLQLDNQGLVTVNAPTTLTRVSADHINSGTIDVAASNLTITQSGTTPTFSNTGSIPLTAARTLTVSGGTLDLTGGTLFGYASTLATSSTTLIFTVPEARTRLALGAATAIPAAFTVPEADSLRLITGTFTAPTLQVDGDLIAEDVVGVTSAVTTGSGSSIIARSTAAFGSGTLTVANGFTNFGTIDLTSVGSGSTSTINVTAGTLVNAPGGVIVATAGSGGTRVIGAQLDNQGTVTINTTSNLNKADADHVNSGTLDVAAGSLSIIQTGATPSFSNTGSIPLTAGRTLSASGGTLDLTGGTLDGYGATLLTTNTTLVFTVPEARTRLQLNTGTVIPSAFTIPAADSLRLITGTFSAPTLQNDGTLIVEDVVTVSSAITTGPGSRILVRSSAAFGSGTLTVVNGFTNTASIELNSVGSGSTTTFNVTNGTLVNGTAGEILAEAGSGGSRVLGFQIDNQGLVEINAPTTLSKADADHLNSGSIDVASQNFTITQSGTTPTFSNTGTILLTAARVLTVSGGTLDLTGGTLSGYSSTLATSSTGLIFTVPEARTRLALGAGTAIPAAFTIPAGDSLRLITGTFAAPTLQVDGALVAEDVVSVTSAVTTGTASQIISRATAAFGAASLTIANGFTNSGSVQLTSVGSGSNASLSITTGTLTNASVGSIQALQGSGGTRTIGAPISQNGFMSVPSPVTMTVSGLLTLNSGSTTTVTGALSLPGGCTNNGGGFSGFTCP
jgi:predicted RNA-binding protein